MPYATHQLLSRPGQQVVFAFLLRSHVFVAVSVWLASDNSHAYALYNCNRYGSGVLEQSSALRNHDLLKAHRQTFADKDGKLSNTQIQPAALADKRLKDHT